MLGSLADEVGAFLNTGIAEDIAGLRAGRGTHVCQFVGAMIDSQKAWTHTSMLSRVGADKADVLKDLFARFDAVEIGAYFIEMANGTWTQQVAMQGWDAQRLEKMSSIIIKQLVLSACIRGASGVGMSPNQRLRMLVLAALDWIDGEKLEGDLVQISKLIGDHPEIRVMLIAPYAPGLAISTVVLRALDAGFPFLISSSVTVS